MLSALGIGVPWPRAGFNPCINALGCGTDPMAEGLKALVGNPFDRPLIGKGEFAAGMPGKFDGPESGALPRPAEAALASGACGTEAPYC